MFFGLFITTFAITISACSNGKSNAEQTAVVQTLAAQIVQARFATQAAETQAAVPPTPSDSPTETAAEISSVALDLFELPAIAEIACIPSNAKRELARVVNVVDGDTIEVEMGGQIYEVRYIGIDSPERGVAFSEQAAALNRQLVDSKNVLLVMDTSETDRYDRLLRYVIVDDKFVNYELVRQGFASAIAYEPDTACDATFVQAQQVAISRSLGFWLPTATVTFNEFSIQPTQPVQQGNCDPAYPDVCIPSPPPDLDCPDVPFRRFTVNPPDPHGFDGDHDGIGCES